MEKLEHSSSETQKYNSIESVFCVMQDTHTDTEISAAVRVQMRVQSCMQKLSVSLSRESISSHLFV